MKKLQLLIIIYFIFFINAAFAQIKRANQYYDNYEYAKAIPLYKKSLKRKETTEALEKIASSYRLIKNYQQAEVYYERLMKQSDVKPIDHFFYGMVLKNNKKIDEAKTQLRIYADASPDDKRGEENVKSIDEIKLWISKTQQFEISTIENINTPHSEFSPVLFQDKLVFTSDRKQDLVNNNKDSWDEQPFLNIYIANILKNKDGNTYFDKKIKPFSVFNTEYHDGPVCFNPSQNTIYLNRVNYIVNKKNKAFVNRPKLYFSNLINDKWTEVESFKYNNDEYSVAHPTISDDGQLLFFASDMPGGKGGMDIYVCKKEGNEWGTPQNLGDDVNTAGSEVFPYMRKDGALYFSSDGHGGFGGLDVFSSVPVEGVYKVVRNLGPPINSSTDDFGIIFSEETAKGYFSSNRPGGKGSDDIYAFTALNKFIVVSGRILFSKDINDPVKNTKVLLFTDEGTIINISNTDNTGYFVFDKLDPDGKYIVKLDENDPNIAKHKKYYLADSQGKIIRVTVINDKGGKFVFQNLPADPNSLTDLSLNDVTIAGNLLFGENAKPLANQKVNLLNDKGEVIASATTNEYGAFAFTNLPPNQNFVVKMDDSDTKLAKNTKVIITNKEGKEIQTTTTGSKGDFVFSLLATDKTVMQQMIADDGDLKFDLKGKILDETKSPLMNSTINLVNDKGKILKSTKTNKKGEFRFANLPVNQDLLFALDENDSQLKSMSKLYLTDENGKIIKEFTKREGTFKFTVLATEQNKLGTIHADDTQLRMFKKDSLSKQLDLVKITNSNGKKTINYSDKINNSKNNGTKIQKPNVQDTPEFKEFLMKYGELTMEQLKFRVQIAAYRHPENFKHDFLNSVKDETHKVVATPLFDGITRFTIGNFNTLKEAEDFRQLCIRLGVYDAFITADFNNKRFLLDELIIKKIIVPEKTN